MSSLVGEPFLSSCCITVEKTRVCWTTVFCVMQGVWTSYNGTTVENTFNLSYSDQEMDQKRLLEGGGI